MVHPTTPIIYLRVSEETSSAAELLSKLHFSSKIVLALKNDGFGARVGRHGEIVERLAP